MARRRAEAVTSAVRAIPTTQTIQRTKAKRAAEEAVTKLPENASIDDLREAANAAVAPMLADIQHAEAKASVLGSMRYWGLVDATPEEQQEARSAVAAALDATRPGCSAVALQATKNAALAPFEKEIRQRKESKRRSDTAAQVAQGALWRVDAYLRENFVFDSYSAQIEEERRIRQELQPILCVAF